MLRERAPLLGQGWHGHVGRETVGPLRSEAARRQGGPRLGGRTERPVFASAIIACGRLTVAIVGG